MTTPAPAVVVSTDQESYNVGDPIVVTVEYPDGGSPGVTLTVSATVTNPDGTTASGTADASVGGSPGAALPTGVTDSFGDTYSPVSNDPGTGAALGTGTAVFNGTVGTPPAGA